MDPVQVTLADAVREQVRRRRIDPQTEADAVRQLAVDAVAEHEKRSLTGAVRSLDEPERVVGAIVADVAGFGPLEPFLDDPTVEEVRINEPVLNAPDPGEAFLNAPIDVQRPVMVAVITVEVLPAPKRGGRWTSERLRFSPTP